MTPLALSIGLPLLALRAPLRTVIGTGPGARRRAPVPLVWRARRADATPAVTPVRPVAGRLDHFHHWSLSVGIDWRIGATTLLRTASVPLFSRREPAPTADAAPVARAAAVDRQLRRSAHTTIEMRTAEIRTHTDRRSTTERITSHSRTERNVASEHTRLHHGVLRHWRTTVQRQTGATTIHASAAPQQQSAIQSPVTVRLRSAGSVTAWRAGPVKLGQNGPTAPTPVPAPSPTAAPTRAASAARDRTRPIPLVWRRRGEPAAPGPESASSPMRSARDPSPAPHTRNTENAATRVTMRTSVAVSPPATTTGPDMNRLVDEVVRRIERQARSERQRRGL